MRRCALAGRPQGIFGRGIRSGISALGIALALAVAAAGCRDSGAGVGSAADAGRDASTGADRVAIVDADCTADGASSALCPVTSCGYLKSAATIGLTETPQAGTDTVCNQERICVATQVATSGDALALTCVVPRAGGLGYGADCSTDAASALRCKDDSLCVAPPAAPGVPEVPGVPFCTTLCRIDGDCAAGSACIDYQHALPDQSYALVGQCTPISKLAGTICVAERDCPAGQGCVRVGDRTRLRTCQIGGPQSLGDSCTAPKQCRSHECYDRDFRVGAVGNRAFCSGACTRSSDCGADQRCVAKVLGNNGTISDPLDDLVVGYCRSLFASPITAACASDSGCLAEGHGADTCHSTYGVCYKAAAVIGGPCASDDGCGLAQACAIGPTFSGGACVLEGCAPAGATGSDVCPDAQSVCSQRASDQPLYRCYEGCSTPGGCSRGAQSYFCAPAQDGQLISICLSR
jgi:hypothetical protein